MNKGNQVSLNQIFEQLNSSSILNQLAGLTGRSHIDISQTIKITTNGGSSKTIVRKKNIISKGFCKTLKTSSINVTVSASKKDKIMDIVFSQVFESLQKAIRTKFDSTDNLLTDKNTFYEIVGCIDFHYENVVNEMQQLEEVYHAYLKNSTKKDLMSLQKVEYAGRIYKQFPQLLVYLQLTKTYFEQFKYEIFTLEQINSLYKKFPTSEFLFDLSQFLKVKETKKKNKKKKNKNKKNKCEQKTDCTESIPEEALSQDTPLDSQSISVIDFLTNMKINEHRTKCNTGGQWLGGLHKKFLR